MQGFHPGVYVTRTAPAAGFTAYTPVLINGEVLIPIETVAVGATATCFKGPGVITGLPKAAGVAIAEGAAVRFDSVAGNFVVAVGANNYLVGSCNNVGGVLAAAATVDVRFDGAVHPPNI